MQIIYPDPGLSCVISNYQLKIVKAGQSIKWRSIFNFTQNCKIHWVSFRFLIGYTLWFIGCPLPKLKTWNSPWITTLAYYMYICCWRTSSKLTIGRNTVTSHQHVFIVVVAKERCSGDNPALFIREVASVFSIFLKNVSLHIVIDCVYR